MWRIDGRKLLALVPPVVVAAATALGVVYGADAQACARLVNRLFGW